MNTSDLVSIPNAFLIAGNQTYKITESKDSDFEKGDSSNDGFDNPSETKYVTLDEFKNDFISKLKDELSYVERIQLIKTYFSKNEKEYDLYIALDEEKKLEIRLTMQETAFKSCMLLEKYFQEPNLDSQQQIYHTFRVFEYSYATESEDRVLKVFCSCLGSKGELAWIQSGTQLSGNEVFDLYQMLADILKVKEMVLYDDAHSEIEISSKKIVRIPIRQMKALASTSEEGYSWYEEKGRFEVASLETYQTKQNVVNQSSKSYRSAISLIRKTPLKTAVKTHRGATSLINRLAKQYLEGNKSLTLHHLFQKLDQLTRQAKGKSCNARLLKSSHKALRDLNALFEKCIDVFDTPLILDKEGEAFVNALKQLHDTRIFVRQG
ncbi:hypothetical protein [Parachlamydia acanthamoebae]|uniref:hypothetical protein n=1 Tax=Parachlamydia acanthamoebae TaxID=83552 RepID=UPI000751A826|nr:hypothetical protein [Parachlamydia acanthamoebae]